MSDSPFSKNSLIGHIGKPYGLRGEFFLTGRHSLLQDEFESVLLVHKHQATDKATTTKVRTQRVQKNRDLISLDALADRTAVEKNAGCALYGIKSQQDEAPDTASELWLNLPVKTQDSKPIGSTVSVTNYGAHDCITIKHPTSGLLLELPLVATYFDELQTKTTPSSLTLNLPLENFEDLWEAE